MAKTKPQDEEHGEKLLEGAGQTSQNTPAAAVSCCPLSPRPLPQPTLTLWAARIEVDEDTRRLLARHSGQGKNYLSPCQRRSDTPQGACVSY